MLISSLPSVCPAEFRRTRSLTSESRSYLGCAFRRLERERVGVAIGSVFQSLIRSVYCGAPASVLLVITYFRGIGCAPVWIHICQSVSCPRNARCSHSMPSTTPKPTCWLRLDIRRHHVKRMRYKQIGARHCARLSCSVWRLSGRRPCRAYPPGRTPWRCCRRARQFFHRKPDRHRHSRRCGDTQFVRSRHLDLPGAGELDLLQLRSDHLDVAIECRRDRFLRSSIVRHRLEQRGRIVGARGRRCCGGQDRGGRSCGRDVKHCAKIRFVRGSHNGSSVGAFKSSVLFRRHTPFLAAS